MRFELPNATYNLIAAQRKESPIMGQQMSSAGATTLPAEDAPAETVTETPTILHLLARAWIGGLALAWDELSTLARSPARILARGEALERTILEQVRFLGDQSRTGSQRFSATLRHPFDWAVDNVQSRSVLAEEELERQIQQALDRLGIPSRERLMQLGAEIDALAERIDEELARQTA